MTKIAAELSSMGSAKRWLAATIFATATLAMGSAALAADPDALWKIVHDQCVPDVEQHGDPKPCAEVRLGSRVDGGYAVLKDQKGATQYLLIPTARISGIENPKILAPDATNYFAAAWDARGHVEAAAGRSLPRQDLSLAINSIDGRTQNQLHIHIDCIRIDVRDALRVHADSIDDNWRLLDVPLAGHRYRAMRLLAEGLDGINPFALLADRMPEARATMGRQTLVVVGAVFQDGRRGFIILNDQADLARADRGSGEDLQDHDCALARS